MGKLETTFSCIEENESEKGDEDKTYGLQMSVISATYDF
jgi:hypothetical protein